MERNSIFKGSIRELNNWLARPVSEGRNWICETSLRVVKYGLVRLVSLTCF